MLYNALNRERDEKKANQIKCIKLTNQSWFYFHFIYLFIFYSYAIENNKKKW